MPSHVHFELSSVLIDASARISTVSDQAFEPESNNEGVNTCIQLAVTAIRKGSQAECLT